MLYSFNVTQYTTEWCGYEVLNGSDCNIRELQSQCMCMWRWNNQIDPQSPLNKSICWMWYVLAGNRQFFRRKNTLCCLVKASCGFIFSINIYHRATSFMWFAWSSSLIELNYVWKYNKHGFFSTFHYLCLLKVMSNNWGKTMCTNNRFSTNVDVPDVLIYDCLIWWLEKKNTKSLKKSLIRHLIKWTLNSDCFEFVFTIYITMVILKFLGLVYNIWCLVCHY